MSSSYAIKTLGWLAAFMLLTTSVAFAQVPSEPTISVQPASALAVENRLSASASVQAQNDSAIAAELAATIAEVHVEAGRNVSKGQLLVSLDARDAKLALRQADAALDAARAQLLLATQRAERGRRLRADRHISEDELLALQTGQVAADAQATQARAARDAAARQLEKCSVHAPFSGVVLERHAHVGALAAPGTPLLRLVSTAAAEVEAQLSPDAAEQIAPAVRIEFESQQRRYALKLAALSPVMERSTRTRLARFVFVTDSAPAGSTGQVSWIAPGLLLPAELMVKRGDERGAFIVVDGKARFVPAKSAEEGRRFQLDVPPETLVVHRGQQSLHDGDVVPTE